MRKDNYLVGFRGKGQCVYGKEKLKTLGYVASYTQPMTISLAIKQLKMLSPGKKAIYKLVKVDPKKERFKQKIQNQMVIKHKKT